jgi:enterochelin esterase-like enzyme
MRKWTAFFLFSLVLSGQNTPRPVISPEVSADRRVTFRLRAPKATEVLLTGEFQEGARPLQKDDTGLWTLTVGPLEPEVYHYNLTIDGVRTIDPNNPHVKTGSTPSTISSILEVPGAAPAFYDGQSVPHGEIRAHWYPSRSTGALRRLTVYTPPGYERNRNRYPVLYLFHGANADETAWTRLGRMNLILDNLIAAGKAKPFLVVMPFGYGAPPWPPASGGGRSAELFAKDLLDDVIPYIQSEYRAMTERENRAVFGLSMGGGQALSIGLNHLELFSHVGGFSSGGLRAADLAKNFAALTSDAKANQKLKLLWVGCGTEDGAFAASKEFSDFLKQHKINHVFRESSGAHTWMVWRRYLNEVAPLLFQ